MHTLSKKKSTRMHWIIRPEGDDVDRTTAYTDDSDGGRINYKEILNSYDDTIELGDIVGTDIQTVEDDTLRFFRADDEEYGTIGQRDRRAATTLESSVDSRGPRTLRTESLAQRQEGIEENIRGTSKFREMFEASYIQKDILQDHLCTSSWNDLDSDDADDEVDGSGDDDSDDDEEEEQEEEHQQQQHDDARSHHDEEERDVRGVQYNYTDFVPLWDRAPVFHIGLKFGNKKEFREAIRSYSIFERRPVKLIRNTKDLMRARCEPPCKWHVYVKRIKALNPHDYVCYSHRAAHNECSETWENSKITSQWLSERYMEKIRANPNMPVSSLRQNVDEQFKCKISRSKAYKTRRKALNKIRGTVEEQYKILYDYKEELIRTHVGSTVEIEITPRSNGSRPRFMRWYSCLGPLKAGWKEVCRPIVFLDGCFVKGSYKGQILTAMGVDPNNGIWPIAWAVVEKEARAQWKWFLQLLFSDLDIEDSCHWTFMSDQQKGLASVLAELVPNADHRNCALHIYRNLKKKHPGKQIKEFFWEIAFSTNEAYYEEAMKAFEAFDLKAHTSLRTAALPKSWVKCFFSSHTKCDTNVNNISESFNAVIVEARGKPILTMLEDIRHYVMRKIREYGKCMEKFEGCITPAIKSILDENAKRSRNWEPICNGRDGFEVRGPGVEQFVVYLRRRTCTCKAWQLSGIPCCHAIACIHRAKEEPTRYVDKYYSREEYLKLYSHALQPINGKRLWPKGLMDLDPPIVCKQPGRPRTKRKIDPIEQTKDDGVVRMRRHIIITCSKCGVQGHNARGCNSEVDIAQRDGMNERRRSEAEASTPASTTLTECSTSKQVRTTKKRLTEAEKIAINVNYEYLGKEPPYKVGRWAGRRNVGARMRTRD